METVEGFCHDAENAYQEGRLQDAIDAFDAAIELVYDDMEAQLDDKRKATDDLDARDDVYKENGHLQNVKVGVSNVIKPTPKSKRR